MIRKVAFLVLFLTAVVWARPVLTVPPDSRQLVVVKSQNWDATTATMRCFERADQGSPWKEVRKAVPVNLGRTGLAWGSSPLMTEGDAKNGGGKTKKEGDGRSPAGLFPFLKAFGHPKPPAGYRKKNLPFLEIADEQCVDDGSSPYYNSVVKPSDVEGGADWKSAEEMKIDLYQLGLVVGHNCPQAKPGLGSCIFFHLERRAGSTTAGCTSMARAPLRELLLWLETEKKPVLLQLPASEFRYLSGYPEL